VTGVEGPDRHPPGAARAGVLRPFLATLLGYNRRRLVWVILIQSVASATQGIALVLLVPLLEVAGVSHPSGRIVALARDVFRAIGLTLSLRTILLVYVVLVAATASLNAYQSVLLVRYRLEFVDSLRRRLYRAIADAEWRHLLSLRQSDLLTALTVDVSWVGQGTLAILSLGVAAIVIGVQVAVALRISVSVTLLASATGLVLMGIVWPLVRRSRHLGRALVENNRGVLASITGFFGGLKLAKGHGLAAGHLDGFGDAIARARRAQIDFARAQAIATAVQLTVTGIILATLVDVSVTNLHLPLAGLLVLAFIFTRLVPQITSAETNVQSVAQALPAFEELMTTIGDCEAAAESSLRTSRPSRLLLREALTLEGVSFGYQSDSGTPVEVLHGANLSLAARTTTAVVGPSGAGKTTIADLIVGLLAPSSGVIRVDGTVLAGERLAAWRESIAMVPQEPFLFHETIRANLLWANDEASEDDLWHALELAQAGFVRRLPYGLDTVVGDRGARVSGGERQRIALARALLRKPELLVLDEATTSLDAANERAILDALASLHGELTVLLIAHQQSTLRDADQIVTVAGGRIVDVTARVGT
jgi:ATP-binding cassette subfamily C protein